MEWLARELPDARLEVIEGAGHGAPNSHPAEFVRQIVIPLVGG
jgi:pimeloyl-ACP methyl ester carboxylesterase